MCNITLCMRTWCEVRNFASQKFRFNRILYTSDLCPVCCCSDCSLRSALWVAWLSVVQRWACAGSAWISCWMPGYLRFFGSGLDLYVYFWKKWIRTGSGYLFNFCNEIFLKVIQEDVTNDGAVVLFDLIFIAYIH